MVEVYIEFGAYIRGRVRALGHIQRLEFGVRLKSLTLSLMPSGIKFWV